MQYIQLIHNKYLKMPKLSDMHVLDTKELEGIEAAYVFSFRQIKEKGRVTVEKNVSACSRIIDKYKDGDIVCCYLEDDSPVAAPVYWDLIHNLPTGRKLYVIGNISKPYPDKEYYKDCLKVVQRKQGLIIYQKTALCLAEKNKGMDEWSFGIPVGPEDATILNGLVKRILSFPCSKKEIILCGRPGNNFKYWDRVRIVGEDIPAPPVQISKKKNRLLDAAKYDNVCILHDRVMLPLDFIERMKEFGDVYPFCTLQSVYFDDYCNLSPIRYSDCDRQSSLRGTPFIKEVVDKCGKHELLAFTDHTFPIIEETGFFCANPLSYSEYLYPTGSLYILKNCIGKKYQLNEHLTWEQYEDVEYGIRLNVYGVITKINSYAFSQSVSSRSVILGMYNNSFYSADNRKCNWKSSIHPFIRTYKPLYRNDLIKLERNMQYFKEKYCRDEEINICCNTPDEQMQTINKLVLGSRFVNHYSVIKEFISDVEKYLIGGRFSFGEEKYLSEEFLKNSENARRNILLSGAVLSVYALRKKKDRFCEDVKWYYVSKNIKIILGSFVSALFMKRKNGLLFYHPRGFKGFYHAIISSTPFRELIE